MIDIEFHQHGTIAHVQNQYLNLPHASNYL